jgi:hypothetical protein
MKSRVNLKINTKNKNQYNHIKIQYWHPSSLPRIEFQAAAFDWESCLAPSAQLLNESLKAMTDQASSIQAFLIADQFLHGIRRPLEGQRVNSLFALFKKVGINGRSQTPDSVSKESERSVVENGRHQSYITVLDANGKICLSAEKHSMYVKLSSSILWWQKCRQERARKVSRAHSIVYFSVYFFGFFLFWVLSPQKSKLGPSYIFPIDSAICNTAHIFKRLPTAPSESNMAQHVM